MSGNIRIQQLGKAQFRATCTFFPDWEFVGISEEEAQAAAERRIERYLQHKFGTDNPIDELFRRLRSSGRRAFIPFVTAGDPDLPSTCELVKELVRRGADMVEIGFPYSDPIADGPVIQASYTRALSKGVRLDGIFAMVRDLSSAVSAPLVGMVSYSLVHRRDPQRFVAEAKSAGLSGLIVPDLPVDEADDLARICSASDMKMILLTTPTTPRERTLSIIEASTGFLYVVSVTGITGVRDRLPVELIEQLEWLHSRTALPLCAGFGISTPEHVSMLRQYVDGAIVGSAIVRHMEQVQPQTWSATLSRVGDLAEQLVRALNPG